MMNGERSVVGAKHRISFDDAFSNIVIYKESDMPFVNILTFDKNLKYPS
jgi:hypothetical protein